MFTEKYEIPVEGSLPETRLCVYILDDSKDLMVDTRPLILMCPGGGYARTSDRESEPMAMRFLAMGCHVAVLRYSCAPAIYPTALLEAAWSMKWIREHAKEWHVDTERIFIAGASAGGHLAASLGMFWHEAWLAEKIGCNNDILKPAGMILCYPVITSGEYAHRGSFENLLANQYTEEMLERTSLEKQVTEHTPKAFIWHTYTDASVPVENSLLLISAMKKKNISVEFHMYPVGRHGLSVCDEQSQAADGFGIQPECATWLPLLQTWLKNFTND